MTSRVDRALRLLGLALAGLAVALALLGFGVLAKESYIGACAAWMFSLAGAGAALVNLLP